MTNAPTPTENSKSNVKHKNATKNFDDTTIADRLRYTCNSIKLARRNLHNVNKSHNVTRSTSANPVYIKKNANYVTIFMLNVNNVTNSMINHGEH